MLDACLISIRKKILAFKTSDNVKLKNDLGIRDGVKNFIDFCGIVDWGIDRSDVKKPGHRIRKLPEPLPP